MIAYVRVRVLPEDSWPYPKDEGWITVDAIDEKGRSLGVTGIMPQAAIVPPENIVERVVSSLRARGWKPPGP